MTFEDAESWDIPNPSYAGWIPTTTGNLSFQVIGRSSNNDQLQLFNYMDLETAKRFIAAVQRRTTADLPLSRILTPIIDPSSKYDCLILASTHPTDRIAEDNCSTVTDQMGALCGEIYIFFHIDDRQTRLKYEELRRLVGSAIANSENEWRESSAQSAFEKISRLVSDYELPPHGKIYFRLYRTGEVRIWSKQDSVVGYAKNLEAFEKPSPEKDREELLEALSHQAYAFLKDLCHRHYHHHSNSDKILNLSLTDRSDDISWRRNTLYALARSVLELRRHDVVQTYRRATGILAYADSFQNGLAGHYRAEADFRKFIRKRTIPKYDFSHTRASIEAKDGEIVWRQNMMATIYVALVTVFLSFIAIWGTLYQVKHGICEEFVRNASGDSSIANGSGSSNVRSLLIDQCEHDGQSSSVSVYLSLWVLHQPFISMIILLLVTLVFPLEFIYKAISTSKTFAPMAKLTKEFSLAVGSSVANSFQRVHTAWADSAGVFLAVCLASAALYLLWMTAISIIINAKL